MTTPTLVNHSLSTAQIIAEAKRLRAEAVTSMFGDAFAALGRIFGRRRAAVNG